VTLGRLAFAILLAGALFSQPSPAPAAARPFADWAAVFVAGDYHAHSGAPSEVFDNARRDVAAAFRQAGFTGRNIHQLSVRPERYPAERPLKSDFKTLSRALGAAATAAPGGCLLYMTSHGSPQGFLLGERVLGPRALATLLDRACGQRPTVVVVSACFSGVFVPALSGPNRMVMTAARPDRSSFGCTEDERYPYFDACILKTLPQASDFMELARRTRICVDDRERAERLTPASEPQTKVGAGLAPLLPLLPLNPAP
jgi:hypothetical protein